jgi:hypothetical protein
MKSKLEVIDYIVDYFSSNPRSLNSKGYCAYHGENGSRCAFSLCCKEGVDLSRHEGRAATSVLRINGFDILKDEFKIEDSDFWDDVQEMHDTDRFWKNGKISEEGGGYVNYLKDKHK